MRCSDPVDAVDLARRFALGGAARLSDGPVARGKQGVVWRLETADGSWAVKVPFHQSSEDEVRLADRVPGGGLRRRCTDAAGAAHHGGIGVRHHDGRQVRVYEWVDLLPPTLVSTRRWWERSWPPFTRCQSRTSARWTPWSHEPVGADRWDQLVEQLRKPGAPFADRLADLRDELVALESWIEPPQTVQTCHRDLWADNVLPTADGGVCVIDWENSGPADPSQELGVCALRVRPFRPGAGPRSDRRLPGGRRAGNSESARTLLDAHRATRAHHRGRRHRLAEAQPSLPGPCRLRRLDRRGARRTAHPRAARNPVGDRERYRVDQPRVYTAIVSMRPRHGLGILSAEPPVYSAANSHLFKAEAAMERVRISRRRSDRRVDEVVDVVDPAGHSTDDAAELITRIDLLLDE